MTTREYKNMMNEGHEGYIPTDPTEIELAEKLVAMRNAWTIEITKERRTTWNNEMMSLKAAGQKANILEIEHKMGFCLADLKAAVVRHKL